MKPVRPVAPEFEALGSHSKSTPVGRAGDFLTVVLRTHVLVLLLELGPARKRPRLVRCPGTELRIPASAREIGVRFFARDNAHRAFDADLSPQRLPVKKQCRM